MCRRQRSGSGTSSQPSSTPAGLAGADHVTYGSDWPFAPSVAVGHLTPKLDRYELSDQQRQAINRGTAETLFPRPGRQAGADRA
jgi:6-methylsalicylate decarboxylase